MSKVFFFDIDMTLCNKQFEVSDKTIQAIKLLKQNGHTVCLSSGRTKYSMQKYIDLFEIDHYVCSEGNSAYYHHDLIFTNPMDTSFVKDLLMYVKDNNLTSGMITDTTNAVTKIDEHVLSFNDEMNLGIHDELPNYYINHDVYKVYVYDGLNHKDLFKDWMNQYPTYEFKGGLVFAIRGKEKGIEALLGKLNANKEDVVVFGDGENDLTMFQYADHGIAMGNAVEELKKHATYVTDSIEEEGIWNACRVHGWI